MRSKTKNRSRPARAVVEPLEARVLYSADPFGLGIDTPDPLELSTDLDLASFRPSSQLTDVFIVDENVPNYLQLINDLDTGSTSDQSVQIYTISNHQSLSDVSDLLALHTNLNTVHFISHGNDASLQLGSSTLNNSTIADFESELRIWGESISESGDLLFYGCNFAESADGQNLAQRIATLTGADVAASADLTGHSSLGGDWALEYATGDIAPESLLLSDGIEAWEEVLATITVTTQKDEVDAPDLTSISALQAVPGGSGISLREAIIAANADPDLDTIILPVISDGRYDLDLSAAAAGTTEDQYSGDLDVWNSIRLQGAGIGDITIDAKNNDRVFSFSGGTSTIENVKIQNGETTEPGGGFLVENTTLTLNYVDLHNNQSLSERGGGIYADGAVTININDSIIRRNEAGVSLSHDQAGGAIHNWSGTVNIERTVFTDNKGNYGGAIFNHGLLSIKDSWFQTNSANDRGGAIHNEGTAFIDRTLFEKNEANGGGAISNTGYALIENTTFSANEAFNHGGAILNTTDGSGNSGVTEIFSSTLAYNIAQGFAAIDTDAGTVNIQSSIIDQSNTNSGVDINSEVVSLGFNLIDTTMTKAIDTDTENTTSGIESGLSDEGGFNQVHALKSNSPAINGGAAIDPNDYTSAQDGTGAARNQIPDIGAFEYHQSSARGSIFWTTGSDNSIYRGNTEGTLSQEIISNRPLNVRDIEVDILNGRIYWLEVDEWTPLFFNRTDLGTLHSAKLDGTDIQTLKTDLLDPHGIALDIANERIFVTNNSTSRNNAGDNSVEIVNYGSTTASPPVLPKVIEASQTDSPPQKMITPTDIEYDPLTSTVIWTDSDGDNGGIQSITGSDPVKTVVTDNSGDRPTGLSIDPDSNTIFWSDTSDTIYTSDIDGSNRDTITASGSPNIIGLEYHKESDTIFATDTAFSGKILAIQADKSGTTELYDNVNLAVGVAVGSLSTVDKEASVEINTGITASEGTVVTISDAHLNAIDPDNASDSITYTLTTRPSTGELWLKDIMEIIAPNLTFTQADIDAGRLEYRHDGSETTDDQFQFTVTDGSAPSSIKTFDISITPINDAPTIASIETTTLDFTENTPVNLSSIISVTDDDDTHIESAVIKIDTAYNSAEDLLLFTNTATITGNWNTGSGELTLTGTDTLASYGNAIKNVSYSNTSENPDTTTRTFSVIVNDGDLDSIAQSRDISITAVNDPPAVTSLENSPVAYTENIPVKLSNSVALSDVDDTLLESAVIRIDTAYMIGEDLLSFSDTATITSSWNTNNGELTLTGTDTLANYEQAIKNASYSNNSEDPDTTTRTFSVNVNDGELYSNTLYRDISITAVNDAPVVTSLETSPLSYTENTPVYLSNSISLSDVDHSQIELAIIKIDTAYNSGEDKLFFTDTATITGSWSSATGKLSLSGTDTLANYEDAIKDVIYSNNSENPDTTTRTFSVIIYDGEVDSNAQSRDISIIATNDSPTLSSLETTTLNYTDGDGKVGISNTISLDDVDNATITSATVQITSGYNSSEDSLEFTNTGSITGAWAPATGTLTLSSISPESIASYQAALRGVSYLNNSPVPDTTGRSVTFSANDGLQDSNTQSRLISVNSINNDPAITTLSTINYVENDPFEAIAPTAIISDPDSPDFDGGVLTISLTAGATSTDRIAILPDGDGAGQINVIGTSVFYEGVEHGTITSGITGQAPLGITLNGFATSQSVQAILRSISYINLSNAPEASVTFEINLTDGDLGSTTVSETIVITAINDAPIVNSLDGAAIHAVNDGAAFLLDAGSTATISDADSPTDFDGGNLTVTKSGFTNVDTLNASTLGLVSLTSDVPNSSVTVSGTVIGTITNTNATSFTIGFNNNATPIRIDEIVQSLQFSSTDTVFGLRSVDLSLTDGDGTSNGGSDTSTTNINIYLGQATPKNLTLAEDTTLIIDANNFDFTGTTGSRLDAITITSLPANGTLKIGSSNVAIDTQITRTQIESGSLTFTPAPDGNGGSYTSFNFYVNSGNKTVQVLSGNHSYYTLDELHDQAASILSSTSNFGPDGTISTDVSIQKATSTVNAAYLNQGKVLFSGYLPDGSLDASELTAIDDWVKAGGIVISTGDLSSHDDLNNFYGLAITNGGSYLWNVDDTSTQIIDGPFGLVSDFRGYGNGGYFDQTQLLSTDLVLARDSSNAMPTMVLRQVGDGHILFTSDEGIFRTDMTGDGIITTPNDILTANAYAWAVESAAPSNFHTMFFDVTPENDQSVISLPDSPLYVENDVPELIMPSATITDIDSTDFDTGTIDVTLTTGASSLDQLQISNTGNITSDVASGTTYYSGTPVGTVSGGDSGLPLVIHLNSSADNGSVQAILRSISFVSTDSNPGTARSFSLDFADGDGGSTTQSGSITITPVNDAPLLHNLDGDLVTVLNDASPYPLDNNILSTISDQDNPADLNGGSLEVIGTAFDANDHLSVTNSTVMLSGGLVTGSQISVSGTIIGSVTAVSNSGLKFSFSANSTEANVSELVQSINYHSDSSTTGLRQVTFLLDDGDGTANNGVSLASATSNIYLVDQMTGYISTPEDTPYTLSINDLGFTGATTTTLDSITLSTLPTTGTMLLAGTIQTAPFSVSKVQLDSGDLKYQPALNDSGTGYSSFEFYVNSGNPVISVLPGKITTDTINGGGFKDLDNILTSTNTFDLSSGTVKQDSAIKDSTNNITAAYLANGQVLFDGYLEDTAYSTAELNVIDSWVRSGGLLLSNNDDPTHDSIATFYGLSTLQGTGSEWIINDSNNALIDGPFGLIGNIGDTFPSSGSLSYFDPATLLTTDLVVAVDSTGNPVAIVRALDDGLALLTSDKDIFQTNFSGNGNIVTANDIFAANTFAWAFDSVPPASFHSVSVDVTPVNDDPINSGGIPTTSTVTEDIPSQIDLSLINLDDIDSQTTDALKLLLVAGSDGILNASVFSGISITGNNTNSLELSGTLTDLNAYLNNASNITYEHNVKHTFGTGADSISISINDNGNTGSGGGTDQLLGTTSIDISPVNDNPGNKGSLPTDLTVIEDATTNIDLSSITISDKDDGSSSIMTVTLSTSNSGVLTANNANNILIDGSSTSINLHGTLSNLNLYLDNTSNISYKHPTDHFNGNNADTLRITVNDNGNYGAGGGSDIDLGTINIHIDEINDDPDNAGALPTAVPATEDTIATVDLSLIILSDVDDSGLPVTLTINSTTGGHLSAGALSGVTINGAGTESLILTGALIDLNSYLNNTTSITYIHPTADINGPSVDTLNVTVNDNGNTGAGGGTDISLGSVNVTISPVNDNPENSGTLPATIEVTEDIPSPIDLSSIDLSDADHSDGAMTVTLDTASGSQLAAKSAMGISSSALGSSLALTGTVADLNTYLDTPANLTYLHNNANTNGNNIDTLSISVNDNGNTGSGGGFDINLGSVSIDINAVNDAPILSTDSADLNYTENDGMVPVSANLQLSDIDTSNLTGATISITSGYLGSEDTLVFNDSTNISGSWNSATGALTLSGTASVPQYQAALSSVSYFNSSEAPSTNQRTVTFKLTDSSNTVSAERNINLFATNDNPIATAIEPTPLNYIENDGPVAVTNSIVLGDADDTLLESAIVMFDSGYQPNENSLSFNDAGGISGNWDQLSGSLTLAGTETIANYESAIRSITYQNNSEHPATDTVTVLITVNDGQADSTTVSRSIETTRLNDAPAIGSAALPPIDEDETSPDPHHLGILLNALFTDPDSSDTLSGIAIINNNATVEGTWEYATDSVTWYSVGAVSDSDALLLDSTTWIRFSPATNYEGTPPALSLRAIDSSFSGAFTNGASQVSTDTQTNGGTTAFSSTISNLTTVVTAINDAPLLNAGANLPDVTEDDPAPAGTTVADIFSSKFSDIDAASSFTGIAIINATTTGGAWQYSLDGSNWITVNGVTNTTALALDTSTQLRFLPTANYHGSSESLSLHAMDDSYSGGFTSASAEKTTDAQNTGGTTSFSDPAYLSVNVTPVNDPPASSDVAIAAVTEDTQAPAGIKFGDLFLASFNDVDGDQSGVAIHMNSATSEGTWQYTIGGSVWTDIGSVTDQNALLLSGDHSLRFLPALHFNGTPPELQARVIDNTFTGTYSTATTRAATDLTALPGDSAISHSDSRISTQVIEVNDPPIGADKNITQLEDQPYQFQISDFSFLDQIDNHTFDHIIIESLPADGTLALDGIAVTESQLIAASLINTGLLEYTAPPNANGASYTQWDFSVVDSGGTDNQGQNTALTSNTIAIDLTAVNDAPEGQDTTVTTTEDTPIIFNTDDFGFTDMNDLHALQAVLITEQPATGTLLINSTPITAATTTVLASDITLGKLSWEPDSDSHGASYTDFKFKVIDNGGTVNGGADIDPIENTVTIDVLPVNDSPTSRDNTLFALEDIDYVFNVSDFGFEDSKDLDSLSAVIIDSLPAAGNLALSGTLVNTNDQISASDISTGKLTFLSLPSGNGIDYAEIVFRLVDDGGTNNGGNNTSQPNKLTIDVLNVNDEPTGLDNTITAIEDTPYTINAGTFGFTDALDGNTLNQVMITTTPESGELMHNALPVAPGATIPIDDIDNGAVTYIPAPSVNGVAVSSFDFRVIDSGGTANGGADTASAAATISIDITSVNDPPFGSHTTLTTEEDTPYLLGSETFGFSDSDDGDTLSSVIIDSVNGNGTLTAYGVPVSDGQTVDRSVIDDGALIFQPSANAHGSNDTLIEFRVVDSGDPDLALNIAALPSNITVDITPVNDAPSAIIVSNIEIPENVTAAPVGEVTVTDYDTGDTHTLSVDDTRFEIVDGQLSLKAGNSIDFELESEIPLSITAIDKSGAPYVQLINLLVQDINDAPVSQFTPETQTASPPFSFALPMQSFVDPDGDTLTHSATLVNGDPLPNWLAFDPITLEFTVSTPALPIASVEILVTANDGRGMSASTSINVILEPEFAPALPAKPTTEIETVAAKPDPEPETEATPEQKESDTTPTDNPELPKSPQEQARNTDESELPQPLEIPKAQSTDLGIELIQSAKHLPVAKTADALFIQINANIQQQQTRENLITEVALSKLANQMDASKQILRESVTEKAQVMGTSVTMASGLSVGYIFWILRSGTLLASILTSLPAWRYIDPLPVLDSLTGDDDDNDQETLESMVQEDPETDSSKNEEGAEESVANKAA